MSCGFQPLRYTTSQMPSTITTASSLGHTAAHIFSGRRRPGPPARSRLSSPVSPVSSSAWTGLVAVSTASARSSAMAHHLLPQLGLDLDRQVDRVGRVHAARPVQVDLEVPDDPAGTTAEQEDPVPQPDCLAYLVGNEEHGQATPPPDPLQH